jgi:tRNA U34 5-methylaminomethyl-2-thiouridine-forming methyltransferase MnmC
MEREVIVTNDGSASISVPSMRVTYHSVHGAVAESMHLFIDAGLKHVLTGAKNELSIFEMGLGTGLNVMLTFLETKNLPVTLYYEAIDLKLKGAPGKREMLRATRPSF